MRARWLTAVVVLLASGGVRAAGESPDDAQNVRGGVALHAGVGGLYGGGVGGALEYQVPLGLGFRLTPLVAGGVTFATGADSPMPHGGWAAAIELEWGWTHRVFLAASFGTRAVDYRCEEAGQPIPCVYEGTYLGPTFLIGYKGTARFGLMWLVYLGRMYFVSDPVIAGPDFGLGLGWKF